MADGAEIRIDVRVEGDALVLAGAFGLMSTLLTETYGHEWTEEERTKIAPAVQIIEHSLMMIRRQTHFVVPPDAPN